MSFETLRFDRTVTIKRVSSTETDDYGNPVLTTTDGQTVRARRAQTSTSEDINGRDQLEQLFTYYFKPSTIIGGRDQLVDDGKLYDVIDEPDVLKNGLGKIHHIEARVRLIEG